MNKIKFKFVKDEPIVPGTPGYFDFYHKYFSPALKEMVLSDSCPHTIGLFSKWGTGKSSIVDQLSKDLATSNDATVFVFDAWKYQEDPLRRTFLLKLEEFLRNKGCKIPSDIGTSYYTKRTNSYSTSREIAEQVEPTKGFFRKFWKFIKEHLLAIAFIVSLLAVATFYILSAYFPENRLVAGIKDLSIFLSAFSALVFLVKPVAEELVKKLVEKIFSESKKFTEIRTQVEEEDRLNSPEQFETIFNKLVACLKTGRLVVVFDNIDRVQGDIALKTLATIKTFLDPIEKSKVIFLVPCDSDAINKQIRAFYKNQEDENFDESEYLKKLFNTVIYTPEFIDDDIYQYTSALIQETGDIKDLLLQEDVLSVITKAFRNNPREVKQFINNLIAAILVASESEVADIVLSKENIGFFTKVIVLRQKFPEAYKKLKENWNDPQKIQTEKSEGGLRDFLTLTSTITTDDAEPFIYFKAPQIEGELSNSRDIRKALVDGNTEEFEKLASAETKKDKLERFVSRLIRNYRSQPQILARLFKTQLQGLANLGIKNNSSDYLNACLETIESVWNSYLEFSPQLVFEILVRSNDKSRREAVIERYVLVLSNEEIKTEGNKTFLHTLINQLIQNRNHLTANHQSKVRDAVQNNLAGRDDILLQFTDFEWQKIFVHPDSIRKIIQNDLTNKTLKRYLPILKLYKDSISHHKFGHILMGRVPEFLSLQNSETPNNTPEKLAFHQDLLTLFNEFGSYFKELNQTQQRDTFNLLNTAYSQVPYGEDTQCKIVNNLRWLALRTSDETTKNQSEVAINNFLSQVSGQSLERVLVYWNEKSRPNFIKAYFASIKTRSVSDDSYLKVAYESADDDQKIELMQQVITNRGDHAIPFLTNLGEKLPGRQELVRSFLAKSQGLPIQSREQIFQFLKGKIAVNDDVVLKQSAIKQILEYLKSNNQNLVDFGATLLAEKFLSDSDQREIAKEMLDFYNSRSGPLQKYDLGMIAHLVKIEAKLQDTLKEKLLFLMFSNISPDRSFETQPFLVEQIALLKPDSDTYEKDYSDLTERLITWPESEQKNQIANAVVQLLERAPGKKSKECLSKLRPTLKQEPELTPVG
jgi:hypothetical protein